MEYIDRLKKLWSDSDIAVSPGATPETISTFEQQHGLTLPADVRLFYAHFNGVYDDDLGFMSFWPIDEVDTVPNKLSDQLPGGSPDYGAISSHLANAQDYFLFADHSIWIHVYAMRLRGEGSEQTPILWIADGRTFEVLANSFAEFWEMYLEDPFSVVSPQ